MVNRKWAYRELFDSEEAAARAYDTAGERRDSVCSMCAEAFEAPYACWPWCAAACLPGRVPQLRFVLNNLMPVPLHMRDIAATCLALVAQLPLSSNTCRAICPASLAWPCMLGVCTVQCGA